MSATKTNKSKLKYEINTTNHTGALNSARNNPSGSSSSRNASQILKSARNKTESYIVPRYRDSNIKFDFVESLREIDNETEPTIDDKTRLEIFRKENISESVIQNWKNRENKNDCFLPYNYNPFVTTHSQYEEKKREEKKFGVKIVNLIDQLNKKTEDFHKMNSMIDTSKKNLDCIIRESMTRSSKCVHTVGQQKITWKERQPTLTSTNSQSKTYNKSPNVNQPLITKKGIKSKEEIIIKEKEVEKYENIEIETIVAEKELSFFIKNKHENHINIFKIHEDSEINHYDLLEQLKFNFESIVDKLSSVRISYLRDLSQLGRGLLINNYKGKELIENHVDTRESTFLNSEITYENIMSLASNRITPANIHEFIKANLVAVQNFDDDKSEVEEEQMIIYNKNMLQVQGNHSEDLQQQEVELYYQMKFSEEEQETENYYVQKGECIEQQLNFKSYLFENMILEEEVHEKLHKLLEKEYKGYLKYDKGYEDEDYIRLININKYKKDRKELIKIKQLKKMLNQKNISDEENMNYFIKQEIIKLIL